MEKNILYVVINTQLLFDYFWYKDDADSVTKFFRRVISNKQRF